MKIILSSTTAGPGGASTVTTEIEVDVNDSEEQIADATRDALDCTKVAAETWQSWSRENETPEQAEQRQMMETRQEQARQELRQMLEGQ